jgi:hypothetical protein
LAGVESLERLGADIAGGGQRRQHSALRRAALL